MRSGFSNKLLVNGVINIVTRSAADTAGTAVAVSAGTFERDQASVGHGGSLGRLAYRVYSQWSDHADSPDGTGASADDRWNSLTTGFRTDWRRGGDAVMAQGGFSTARVRSDWNQFFTPSPAPASLSGDVGEIRSGTIMDRWTHSRPGGSVFQVQPFQTTRSRDESIIWSTESIDDVELQYRTAFGARHDLIVGGGYRDSDLTTRPTSTLVIPSIEQAALNMFVQDEIGVGPRVTVTLGSKVEHNTLAGWGASPSARVMLNVTPTTERAWAAVSRARRTPSAAELGARFYVSPATPGCRSSSRPSAIRNFSPNSSPSSKRDTAFRFRSTRRCITSDVNPMRGPRPTHAATPASSSRSAIGCRPSRRDTTCSIRRMPNTRNVSSSAAQSSLGGTVSLSWKF